MEKKDILEGIHMLVSNNVIGDKQLASRYKGFRGELFLENYLTSKYPNYKQMEGGIIISKDSNESSLDNSLYLSIIPEEDFDGSYVEVFSFLSKLNFQKMYLISYTDNWKELPVMKYANENISLNVPDIIIHEFDTDTNTFKTTSNNIEEITDFFTTIENRKKNSYPILESTKQWLIDNLEPFSTSQLIKIYLNRLFLDGYLGFGKEKGKPSDIDMIVKTSENVYRLIEVKEKDLPKFAKKGFGLDVPRLNDLVRISYETQLEYYLIVRQINNQTERELVAWKFIKIDSFFDNVKEDQTVIGGTGMRSINSKNETLICDYNLFNNL
ncbi:hypothetical protein [Flavobacterium sp. HJSW_4]|uniref:hypothetical protein n=1 Tax=Flavobacterium sp. HJSW_4 TaxID=3344660 RepID=UPI0035F25F9A